MLIIDFEMTEYMKAVFDEDEISSDTSNIEFGKTTINNEQLAAIPMDEFTDAFALWPGIAPFGESFTFRGSRPFNSTVHYYLDGVDVTNLLGRPINGGAYSGILLTDIPEGAIEKMFIQSGGYSAEYGNSLAGVVNMSTKSNLKKVSAFFRHKRTASEFGFGEKYLKSQNFLTNEESIKEARRIGTGSKETNNDYYGSPSKMFVNPAYNRYEFGVNAPLELNVSRRKQSTLLFGFYGDILKKGGFLRGQKMERGTYMGKLEYHYNPLLKFKLNFLTSSSEMRRYDHHYSRMVSTSDTLYAFTGQATNSLSTPVLVGSLVMPNGEIVPVENYDMLNNLNRPEISSSMLSFSMIYQANKNVSIEGQVSKIKTEEKYRNYDPSSGKELSLSAFWETRFNNPSASEFFPPGAPTATKLESYWWIQPMVVERWKQDVDQIINNFKIKLSYNYLDHSLEFGSNYSEFESKRMYDEFASGVNAYKFQLDFRPSKFAVYINVKFKLKSIYIHAGLRFEDIKPDLTTNLDKFLYDDEKKNDGLNYLSGNLRLIFPVLEKNVLYLDYAKYATHPVFEQYFANSITNKNYHILNYKLKPERVDYYGLGVKSDYINYLHISLTGYLKIISNLQNFNNYQYFSGPTSYPDRLPSTLEGNAEIKGYDLSITTDRTNNILFLLNYTNQSVKLTSFTNNIGTDDFIRYRNLPWTEFTAGWHTASIFNLIIDYRIPEQGGLDVLGCRPFSNSGISFLWKYHSGRPYTSAIRVPPPEAPPINDVRFPSSSQIDLKLFKNFKIWQSVQAGLFIEIFNFTNERTLMDISYTEYYYLGTDEGDGTWNDPSVWSPPREVRFGFEVSF